jgi:N-formylglutamate amidohydrolase
VNRLSERASDRATLVTLTPVDPARHALETRIESAKARIVEDLNRATAVVRDAATRAGQGLLRVALLAGLVVAGAVIALARARRRRRLRIAWK